MEQVGNKLSDQLIVKLLIRLEGIQHALHTFMFNFELPVHGYNHSSRYQLFVTTMEFNAANPISENHS